MSDVRIVALLRRTPVMALHKHERELAAATLLAAIVENEADREVLNDVAEMILNAQRAGDFGGLNDA